MHRQTDRQKQTDHNNSLLSSSVNHDSLTVNGQGMLVFYKRDYSGERSSSGRPTHSEILLSLKENTKYLVGISY